MLIQTHNTLDPTSLKFIRGKPISETRPGDSPAPGNPGGFPPSWQSRRPGFEEAAASSLAQGSLAILLHLCYFTHNDTVRCRESNFCLTAGNFC